MTSANSINLLLTRPDGVRLNERRQAAALHHIWYHTPRRPNQKPLSLCPPGELGGEEDDEVDDEG